MAQGGPRPGAGRPVIYDSPMATYNVRIPKTWHHILKRLGQGNFSRGVRDILAIYVEEEMEDDTHEVES